MDGAVAGAVPHLRAAAGGEVRPAATRNLRTALLLAAVAATLFLLTVLGYLA